MVMTNEETRQGKYIKVKPSILKKAQLRAVSTDKALGEWLEETIEEKIERTKEG